MRKPTEHDRCRYCDAPIDPHNYTSEPLGFMCEPCGEDYYRYTTTAHDQELAS